jgi:AraC-like DNA-binding protein
MGDARCLISSGELSVFYKCLKSDLVDVEFYTNTPCFVYIESGEEVITTSDNQNHKLSSNSVIFLPQGQNLHSDFVRSTDSLKAYLIFINDELITEYLCNKKSVTSTKVLSHSLFQVSTGALLNLFFDSITLLSHEAGRLSESHKAELLKIKLLEFLNLLALTDAEALISNLSIKSKTHRPKRNISRLLEGEDILKLSLNDLSNLSGRSLSSFNRDFKAIYNMPPKRWLQEKRLAYARKLLIEKEYSVTEVAMNIGYDNVSHFIKQFKEKYNITPKQLKQEQFN